MTAARDRLQDGRLDFEKASLVKGCAQGANDARSGREVPALRGIAEQVEVALAVPRLLVLETVKLLRWRVQRLDEQGDRVDEHARFTPSRARDRSRDPDDVAEVEHLHHRVGTAGAISAKPHLQAAGLVLDVGECGTAQVAQLHDPAGHRHNGAVRSSTSASG